MKTFTLTVHACMAAAFLCLASAADAAPDRGHQARVVVAHRKPVIVHHRRHRHHRPPVVVVRHR